MEKTPNALQKTTPSLEATLINTLQQNTVHEIVQAENIQLRLMLIEIQSATTMQTAIQAPKIYQLKQTLGERDLLKLVCLILKSFADSVRVKQSNLDIIDAANLFIEKYPQESVKDLILALKQAKTEGFRFYNCLSQETIFGLLEGYFERKCQFLENEHLDRKVRESTHEKAVMQTFSHYCPQLARQIAHMIPDNHPNREVLREKLRIDTMREKRGIVPQQAYRFEFGQRRYLQEPTRLQA